jgi:ribonucleoside-triphosphate reductase
MATALRTYHRPLREGETTLESWSQVVDRVVGHQRWLWERALGRPLNEREEHELEEVRQLILGRYIAPAGRTLWLGGTELSQSRESCMFNCSFTHIETVYDLVDVLWLLLQGCGVGFNPVTGTLNGF